MNEQVMGSGPMDSAGAPLRPLWARFWGVLVNPRAIFEELTRQPAWIGAALLLTLFSLVIAYFMYEPILYPTMMEQAERQITSSEQLAQAEAMYASGGMKIFISAFAAVMNLVIIFVIGFLVTGASSFLLGAKITWKQGVSVAAHSLLVLIPRSLVTLPIMFQRESAEVSLGPGVFFPPSEAVGFGGKFFAALMGGFDLFQLWALALVVLGVAVAGRQEPGRVARVLVPGYLVLIVILSLFSGMQGG